VGNSQVAEDLLQEGFILMLKRLSQLKEEKKFEGWMKRLFTNLAIDYLRKNKKVNSKECLINNIHELNNTEEQKLERIEPYEINESQINMTVIEQAELSQEDLEECLSQLPDHYRIVFNMYVIDGYSHKEIAQELNINAKTSKSRLSKARRITQHALYQKAIIKIKKQPVNIM